MKKLTSSKNLKNKLLKFRIIPTYTEDTLFLMSLTFIILFFSDKFMRYQILDFISGDGRLFLVALLAVGGIIFSIYNAFSFKKKTDFHKFFMISFAVFANAGAGISAGAYLFKTTSGLWTIFPILNLANAILLLLLFRIGKINEKSISDEQSKLWEIALGKIIVLIIIFISHFIYKNYWSLTFSIAVGYATSLNDSIKNLIFNKITNQ